MSSNEGTSRSPNTYKEIVSSFGDFLTVAIHTILYERNIYPQTSFLSAKKYNFSVRQNRHPKVCEWVQDAVAAVEAEMLKGTVARVAVVIYSASSQPLERFLFDVSRFPKVPPGEATTPFEKQLPSYSAIDLDEQLRAVMSRLTVCGGLLKSIPKGCSFTVCIELKEDANPPLGHPQPWITAQPSLQAVKVKGDDSEVSKGADLGGVSTTPVRTVEAGEFTFELWIEEAKRTLSNQETASNDTVMRSGASE